MACALCVLQIAYPPAPPGVDAASDAGLDAASNVGSDAGSLAAEYARETRGTMTVMISYCTVPLLVQVTP